MLRFLIVMLLLANGLYYAWAQGHLAGLGLTPHSQREPQRMAAQIKPEVLKLQSAGDARRAAAASATANPSAALSAAPTANAIAGASAQGTGDNTAPSAASKPTECLQTALLNDTTVSAVRSAASAALPSGSWTLEAATEPGRWIIYMGKYANQEAVSKKKAELRQLDVAFEPLQKVDLEPGISLGGFVAQADANQALNALAKQGVRTAKVVQETAPARGQVLRLPAVDDALRSRLEPVRSALGTQVLRACKP